MENWKKFSRVFFLFALLTSLLAGISAPVLGNESASAAPMVAPATTVVISEFRTTGPSGGNDEFIELYNPTTSPVDVSNWEIHGSNNAGGGTTTPRATLPTGTIIQSGQYYLIANTSTNGYSGSAAPNTTYSTGIADDGGIALTLPNDTPVDQVGMSAGSAYKEGTILADITTTTGQSYERYLGGALDSCQDNNDNIADFQPINPSNPQNASTPRRLCGVSADLSLLQVASNMTPNVGEFVDFTITITNGGQNDATNVTVMDSLPAGLSFATTPYTASAGIYNTGTGIWTVGTLLNGASETLTLHTRVDTGGVKTNWAEVWSSDQVDPDSIAGNSSTTEDDDDSQTVTSPTTAGLTITNDVNNPTPNVGSNVVFTIIVSNFSGSGATGVQVNTTFPAGLVFISSAPTTAAGDLNIGTLNNNSTITFIITAKVSSSGTKNFQATVTSNFSPSSATAIVTPVLSTEADLSLSQTWARSTTAAGRVDLKITVTNNETVNSATNVQVRDLLPSGLTYFSHSGGSYNNSTGIWAVGTLAAGKSSTLTITAKVATDGDGTRNFAEVWQSDQYDPDSTPGDGDQGDDDDTNHLNASVPGPEILITDLSLTETVDFSGGNAVFSITVRNSGPDDANNVLIKNSKLATAANYTYISHSSTAGTYIPTSGDWNIPTLLDGTSARLTVTTTIVSPAVNWTQVSAVTEVDPDSRPNNCSNTVLSCTEDDDASAPSADLSLTQSVNDPNPNVGDNVVFTITVSNAGVAATTNVQVKDTLPSGLTYVSDTGGGKYNKTSGIWTVTASNVPFANGASQTLKITAKVAANGIKTNWAEVWKSDEADPDSIPGNGSTTEDDDDGATITSYRSIIINEVAWSGTAASADDEWIELYNPSNASINITGWILKSTSGSLNITLSGSIAAGGYFLLERDNNSTVSDITADQIYPVVPSNKLSDDGEVLILCGGASTNTKCGGTNFIDTANQEGSSSSTNPWPKGSLSPNYGSMERVGTSAETDKSWATNSGYPRNGLNANNGPIYGTPKRVNSTGANQPPNPVVPTVIVYSSRIVINEFLPRPGFDWNQDGQVDVFDEFIEIKNIGNATGSLSGWQLDDVANGGSNPFTLPNLTLKVGERVVFYGSQTNILLSDGGDTVRLLNGGKVYDAYTYAFAEFEDQSVCRLPDGFGSWYEDCIPTPNLTNTREGTAPSMPDSGGGYVSPVCDLPDTLPADFLYAECGGYGADIWHSYYWDQSGWYEDQNIPSNMSKWESFVQ